MASKPFQKPSGWHVDETHKSCQKFCLNKPHGVSSALRAAARSPNPYTFFFLWVDFRSTDRAALTHPDLTLTLSIFKLDFFFSAHWYRCLIIFWNLSVSQWLWNISGSHCAAFVLQILYYNIWPEEFFFWPVRLKTFLKPFLLHIFLTHTLARTHARTRTQTNGHKCLC